jgi:hypothetical protein
VLSLTLNLSLWLTGDVRRPVRRLSVSQSVNSRDTQLLPAHDANTGSAFHGSSRRVFFSGGGAAPAVQPPAAPATALRRAGQTGPRPRESKVAITRTPVRTPDEGPGGPGDCGRPPGTATSCARSGGGRVRAEARQSGRRAGRAPRPRRSVGRSRTGDRAAGPDREPSSTREASPNYP